MLLTAIFLSVTAAEVPAVSHRALVCFWGVSGRIEEVQPPWGWFSIPLKTVPACVSLKKQPIDRTTKIIHTFAKAPSGLGRGLVTDLQLIIPAPAFPCFTI